MTQHRGGRTGVVPEGGMITQPSSGHVQVDGHGTGVRRRRRVPLLLALGVVVVVVIVVVLVRPWASDSEPPAQPPVAASPTELCSEPSSSFAPFSYLTSQPDPTLREGTVHVGNAQVPPMSMYTSTGAPGTGVLCVSARSGASNPIQAVARPRSGDIAYVGEISGSVFFAVRPGIVRVTLQFAGESSAWSFDLSGPDEARLQSLDAAGWHAANTEFGMGGTAGVTVRAYGEAGDQRDLVVEKLDPAQPQTSSARR